MASQAKLARLSGGEPWAFCEYHHYDSGLRIEQLGLVGPRPAWAPPAEWAGFRNEVVLSAGDILFDFTRFIHAGYRVNWLGLYTFSLDAAYGNRENYAGLGIWICEREITKPELVLRELHNTFTKIRPDTIAGVSGQLLHYINSPGLLPSRLVPIDMVPRELAGWRRSADPLPIARVIIAREHVEMARWPSISDEFLRASYLPEPGSDVSRLLILLLDPVNVGRPLSGVEEPRGGVAAEFIQQIPAIFGELVTAKSRSDELLRLCEAEILSLRQDIDTLSEERHNLQLLNEQLNEEVSKSDFALIAHRISVLERAVTDGNKSIQDEIKRSRTISKPVMPPTPSKPVAYQPVRNIPTPGYDAVSREWTLMPITIAIAIGLVLVVIGFAIGSLIPFRTQSEKLNAASYSDADALAPPITTNSDNRPIDSSGMSVMAGSAGSSTTEGSSSRNYDSQ